ncbi:MAG TPA: acyltransferase [Lachnospiraceae bacterium]|nr:acyltransferase [Lachnospiraceae bacterium]
MKKSYIELLRVIAIILVVFNHTRSLGYSLYTNTNSQITYWISLAASLFCKVAVPVFFMISGGVLLGKKESITQLYQKRVLRIILVILIFTFLQYLRIVRVHPDEGFSILKWLDYCMNGNIIEPYWYLKVYLAMLICLPFLRFLAAEMEDTHYIYLLSIKFIFMILSLVSIYTGKMPNLSVPFLDDVLFYPLIGYYLVNKFDQGKLVVKLNRRICSIALAFLLILITFLAGTYYKTNDQYIDGFHTVSAWLMAILLFISVKRTHIPSAFWVKVIGVLGSCTFGVYLIEDVVRNQFVFLVPMLSNYIGDFSACLVFVLVSVFVSMLAIYIVKKIPYINKLI